VDPLRAPAVSIIGARIVHFCSIACREERVRSSLPAPVSAEPPDQPSLPLEDTLARPSRDEAPERSRDDTAPGLAPFDSTAPPGAPFVFWRDPSALGALIAALAGLCALLLPGRGRFVGLGLCILLALWQLVRGVLRARNRGPAWILEEAALPVAAGIMLAEALVGKNQISAVVPAALVLATGEMARLLLWVGRRRSGVLELWSSSSALLNPSFRDNTRWFSWTRRLGAALSFSRFPVALMCALGAMWLGGFGASQALAMGVCALLALSSRPLWIAAQDAYHAAALRLVRLGVQPRDAEAIEQLGASRVFLFEGAGTAFAQEPVISSFWVVPPHEETHVLEVIADLEGNARSRVARALAEFANGRGVALAEGLEGVRVSDQGVEGTTRHGEAACGSRFFVLSMGIATGVLEERAAVLEDSGRRAVMVAAEGRAVAILGIEDRPEPLCSSAAKALGWHGRHCVMMSTAEATPAKALAHRCGFSDARFETAHAELRNVVVEITSSGERPVVVGGSEFIEDVVSDAVTIRVAGEGFTQGAFDARKAGISVVPVIYEIAAGAKKSTSNNTVLSVIALLLGVGLSLTWPSFSTAAAIAMLLSGAAVISAVNRPFPGWTKAALKCSLFAQRALKRIRAFGG
jgi:hypothetical protein